MSGFLEVVIAAARQRRLLTRGIPFDELEDMADRMASGRHTPLKAWRRPGLDRGAAEAGDAGPPHLLGTLAGADPELEIFFEEDPVRRAVRGVEAGLAGIVIVTEPEFHRGDVAWLEPVRRAIDAVPLLVWDVLLDPRHVLETLTRPIDMVLLDPAVLGAESLNEAIAMCRAFQASTALLARSPREVEVALEQGPDALLLDRRDPISLLPRPGMVDRLLEASSPFPGLRLVAGLAATPESLTHAARRPVDAFLLPPAALEEPGFKKRIEELRSALA